MKKKRRNRVVTELCFGLLAGGAQLVAQATNTFPMSCNVGIGTTSPAAELDVEQGSIKIGAIPAQSPNWSLGSYASDGHFINLYPSLGAGNYNNIVQAGDQSIIYSATGSGSGAFVLAPWANATSGLRMNSNGDVGIGTSSPGAMLDVAGSVRISGGGAGLTFPDGTTQGTAYTGTCTATGGDYAESVDVSGEKTDYEPGDVIVLDPENPGHFLLSSEPYSVLVAGIYSTKPGYVGRRQKGDPKLAKEIPMAMIGIVPTKVTTENGPIKIGDQLVTSTKPGYVMKGTDRNRMNGSVVGKAMGSLGSGTGVIEVLVSLQ